MNKRKIALLLALVVAAFGLAACGGTNGGDPTPAPPAPTPEYQSPSTLPEELDPEDLVDLEWPEDDIFVDGVALSGVRARKISEDELFPTHVPLFAVADALGMTGGFFWDADAGEVTLEGLIGTITLTIDSNVFTVNGETVELFHPAIKYEDEIYVPLLFFRDVFGAGSAFSEGGQIFISSEEDDMQ